VTAVFYVLVLVPFNQYHLEVFGIAVRPAAFVPAVFGILWGPAAAWGLGIGNIPGDYFGGSWSLMSVFGFLVNVLYPYLAYRLWHRMMRGHEMRLDPYSLGCFWAVALAVTFACMLLLAASGTIFFGRPFESKFASYFINNIFWAVLVGPVLFALMFGPAVKNRLVYGREWDRRFATAAK
jgi:energy-coupling factor transport system substrate-specific component